MGWPRVRSLSDPDSLLLTSSQSSARDPWPSLAHSTGPMLRSTGGCSDGIALTGCGLRPRPAGRLASPVGLAWLPSGHGDLMDVSRTRPPSHSVVLENVCGLDCPCTVACLPLATLKKVACCSMDWGDKELTGIDARPLSK